MHFWFAWYFHFWFGRDIPFKCGCDIHNSQRWYNTIMLKAIFKFVVNNMYEISIPKDTVNQNQQNMSFGCDIYFKFGCEIWH